MAEYIIKVADERGRVVEQLERANSEAEVRERVAQQGLHLQSIRGSGLSLSGLGVPRRRKVRLADFLVFNQQLYTLIHAGLPILSALNLLYGRQRNAYFKSLLQDVRTRVQAGAPLSEAFGAQGIFPKIYTTTLLAGERSGNLEEVLTRYIGYQKMALSVRKRLLASLIYPAILICMVTIMLTFLITYVVPRFAELYGDLQAKLPALTIFMLDLGRAAQHYFFFFLAAVVIVIFLLFRWRRSSRGAEQIDRFVLRLPLLGGIWLKYQVALFSRTLSTLLAGGIPLVTSLETAGSSMPSRHIGNAIAESTERVREGRGLAESLQRTDVFPDLSIEMIEVGESTGALNPMLNSVADFFEEDVQTALTAAMSLIEPAILIVMGVVVGFVLLSLYLPIFSLGANGVGR